ncbi:hypothetical protein ABEB36_000015 [Hypothenemus hampei]|uniref:Uncharacterized protein n=1 Tax=Hypothenemus hampei TaxID=57062 RepID=A0ABD1F9X9_HYPHA
MDKFGRSFSSSAVNSNQKNIKILQTFSTNTLSLRENGQYDGKNHTICNLGEPVHPNDAVNKAYVDSKWEEFERTIQQLNYQIATVNENISLMIFDQIPTIHKKIDDADEHTMEFIKKSSEYIQIIRIKLEDVMIKLKDKKII